MDIRTTVLGTILGLLVAPGPTAAAETGCRTLDACLAQLHALAGKQDRHGGMGPEAGQLLDRIRTFDDATPALVGLLRHPDDKVAEFAAYGLRDTASIDPKYLPEIIAGLDRGLGWLPPALSRMDSDEAAREAVSRYLVSESAPHNQEAYAVKLLGDRAIPYIVEAARCHETCGQGTHYLLAHVLGEMGPESKLAAPALLQMATDTSSSRDVAAGALLMIASLKDADFLESPLIALREERLDLAGAVDDALIGIGSGESGGIFAARLQRRPDPLVLRDLAETGAAGHGAGRVVIELLRNDDWDLRLAAARTLGYIGYLPAVPALIPLLDLPDDVRLNWVAAESLGRLSDPSASDALSRIARSHWHPAVRKAASTAVERIRDGAPYASAFPSRNFPLDFFSYQRSVESGEECRTPLAPRMRESSSSKLHPPSDEKRLQALSFPTEILSYGAREDPETPREDGEIIVVTAENIVEHRTPMQQVPHVALRIDKGWLVGSDRGEWGGELVFAGDDGTRTILLDANIEDIYRLGDLLVAVTGIAHLGINEGMVFTIETDPWSTRPWRSLPGAPRASWLTKDGRLLVQVLGGDGLLVSADGTMQMARCRR